LSIGNTLSSKTAKNAVLLSEKETKKPFFNKIAYFCALEINQI
jgi:hypothetical protein